MTLTRHSHRPSPVPAGFTNQVHDRAVVRGPAGSKWAGDFLPAKAAELPVSIDILGRAFSEPLQIRIAAGYEAETDIAGGQRISARWPRSRGG
jgi:hypothetical protein